MKEKEVEEEEEVEKEQEQEKPAVKQKEVFLVARELPQQPIRQVKLEDGSIGTVLTIEEALTEIINILKKLEKGLL